jgi:hypothetical protein
MKSLAEAPLKRSRHAAFVIARGMHAVAPSYRNSTPHTAAFRAAGHNGLELQPDFRQ